jgi:hypothetical protein
VVGLIGFEHQGSRRDEQLSPSGSADGVLLPPSVDEWLPERHLARFVVEVIDGLDLRALIGSDRGSGSASYHPAMLLGLLVYGYATEVFSSRKLEQAMYDLVAFRLIAANDHPDHDTIATPELVGGPAAVFEGDRGAVCQGVVAGPRDGDPQTGYGGAGRDQDPANASRHSALSYEHAGKLERQLKAEVAVLLAKAEAADKADVPDGMPIPEDTVVTIGAAGKGDSGD